MGGLKRLPVTGTAGGDFHDPPGADPGLGNVRLPQLGAQRTGYDASVAYLVIHCHERDLAPALELAVDLTMQRLLIAPDGQKKVSPLLLEMPKNGR